MPSTVCPQAVIIISTCRGRSSSSRTSNVYCAPIRYQVLCWAHYKGCFIFSTLGTSEWSFFLSGRLKNNPVLISVSLSGTTGFSKGRDLHRLELLESVPRRAWALGRAGKDNRGSTSRGEGGHAGSGVNETDTGHQVPKLPFRAPLELVPAHCKINAPAQHALGYSMYSVTPPGFCPCSSLCPCLLQLSSSILWVPFYPLLRKEATSPGTTKAKYSLGCCWTSASLKLPGPRTAPPTPTDTVLLPSFLSACPKF